MTVRSRPDATWIPPELERLAVHFAARGSIEVARRLRAADLAVRDADDDDVRKALGTVRAAIETAAALGGQARARQLLDAMLDAVARREASSLRVVAGGARRPAAPSWIPTARHARAAPLGAATGTRPEAVPTGADAPQALQPSAPRHPPLPACQVRIDPPFADALDRDLDDQVDVLFAASPVLPGNSHVVVRADGGLWVTVGHEVLSTIFGVPAGAWRLAGAASGVVPCVGAGGPDVEARLRFRG